MPTLVRVHEVDERQQSGIRHGFAAEQPAVHLGDGHAQELGDRYPPKLDSLYGVGKAVRTQEPEFIPEISDELLVAASEGDEELLRILRELRNAISSYDSQIEKLAQAHPDFVIFDSFPGAGAAMAPRLIAAFGTCRDRYRTAHEIQCYSGIAPVVESSGKQRWVHCRWSCPKFLRQTFHEWALHSMGSSAWAKDYYRQQRTNGKSHHSAVRA